MAKQKDTTRTGWNRTARAQRPAVASASGRDQMDIRRPEEPATIRRMGPYETRYEVDFGYVTEREVL